VFTTERERSRYVHLLEEHIKTNDSIKMELHTTKYIHKFEFDSVDESMKLWDAIFITNWIKIPFRYTGNYYFKSGFPSEDSLPIAYKTYKAAIKTPLRCYSIQEAHDNN